MFIPAHSHSKLFRPGSALILLVSALVHKLHLFLPNVYSHPAKRHAHFGDRCANLYSPVLEALQVLKFSYKQDRLNFTSDLIAEEADYNISGPVSKEAIDELIQLASLTNSLSYSQTRMRIKLCSHL